MRLLQLDDRVVPSTASLLEDVGVALQSPDPQGLTAVGTTLYFSAFDGAGSQLGKFDGSTFTEVKVGTYANPDPQDFTAVGGTLYFVAADDSGNAGLWKYDGSSPPVEIKVGTPASPSPADLTAVGGTLYFTAFDGSGRPELWQS